MSADLTIFRKGTSKFRVEKFKVLKDFTFWYLKIKAILVQHGLLDALQRESKMDKDLPEKDKNKMLGKVHSR